MDALKFDSLKVNVDLAKKYIKENEDAIKNRTIPKTNEEVKELSTLFEKNIFKGHKILAEKVKENSELICQLEYLTNNIPVGDTEKNIQLILKYTSLPGKYKPHTINAVPLLKDTPLICLAYGLNIGEYSACDERAAVCHLFVKLALDSGLCKFEKNGGVESGNAPSFECIGVVAERSDLDSAVDAFLDSSSHSACFWRLSRIFVQESIYKLFKELVEHQAKLKGACATGYEDLKSQCTDCFVFGKKIILFDYAGDVNSPHLKDAHSIYVEAYRTNKELLSLASDKENVRLVSLWSSDVAEANEIAFKIPASLVWINDYANFNGPPEIFNFYSNYPKPTVMSVPRSLVSKYESWKTYDKEKRLSIISGVLSKEIEAFKASDEKTRTSNLFELQELIRNTKSSSVDVADGKMCVALDSPVGFTNCFGRVEGRLDANGIASLVAGNGIICMHLRSRLYTELFQAGVPVWDQTRHSEEIADVDVFGIQYRTRVVLTNFGTIFAN